MFQKFLVVSVVNDQTFEIVGWCVLGFNLEPGMPYSAEVARCPTREAADVALRLMES